MVPYCVSTTTETLGVQIVNHFEKFHTVGLGQLQIGQQNVHRGMLQDLQGFLRRGHPGSSHPALLGDDRARLADGEFVIHNEDIHRSNFAANSGFFTHS